MIRDMTLEGKLDSIEKVVAQFIADDVRLIRRYNQILLEKGDLFLDFTVNENDIDAGVESNAEKGVGHPFEVIF